MLSTTVHVAGPVINIGNPLDPGWHRVQSCARCGAVLWEETYFGYPEGALVEMCARLWQAQVLDSYTEATCNLASKADTLRATVCPSSTPD